MKTWLIIAIIHNLSSLRHEDFLYCPCFIPDEHRIRTWLNLYIAVFDFVDLHGATSAFTNVWEIWFEDDNWNSTILDQCSCSFGSEPDRLKSWSSGNLVVCFSFKTLLPKIVWTISICELQGQNVCNTYRRKYETIWLMNKLTWFTNADLGWKFISSQMVERLTQ